MQYSSLIQRVETEFDDGVQGVADSFLASGVNTMLVAGGSCVGKTTMVKKLAGILSKNGKTVHTVSLDDFYRYGDECVYLPDGTKDVESIHSLRVDMIKDVVYSLSACRATYLPRFDFLQVKRIDRAEYIEPKQTDMFVIEGLHAFNPMIVDKDAKVYRLYLYTEYDRHFMLNPRLVRRLVRDSIRRGSDAMRTFKQWKYVYDEEKIGIMPFAVGADAKLNTYFAYEPALLKRTALEQIAMMPKDNPYAKTVSDIRDYFDGWGEIGFDEIPQSSLMKEFI